MPVSQKKTNHIRGAQFRRPSTSIGGVISGRSIYLHDNDLDLVSPDPADDVTRGIMAILPGGMSIDARQMATGGSSVRRWLGLFDL